LCLDRVVSRVRGTAHPVGDAAQRGEGTLKTD
jgi:hypothetical protein